MFQLNYYFLLIFRTETIPLQLGLFQIFKVTRGRVSGHSLQSRHRPTLVVKVKYRYSAKANLEVTVTFLLSFPVYVKLTAHLTYHSTQ